MKNKIIGCISILMGGSALYRWFAADPSIAASQPAAYDAGHTTGMLVAGIAFVVGGLYYFFKRPS